MSRKRTLVLSLTIVLFIGIVLLASWLATSYFDLRAAKDTLTTCKHNDKILNFTKLFIDKVLKSNTEVSFEDRLKLENAVRDIGDDQILKQWQAFIECKTETQAQEEVKNLLEILVNKISY